MANLSKSLTAIGQGLSQVGSTIQNYHDKKQEAEYLKVRKEQAGIALEEAKLGQAVNRIKIGMQLQTPALRKNFLKNSGNQYLKTMFGEEVSPEVIDYMASDVGSDVAKYVFENADADLGTLKGTLQKAVASGALRDSGVAHKIFTSIMDLQQKQANLRKTQAESTSAFGDPKFAFKTAVDDATFKIKDATDKLTTYRKTIATVQEANQGASFDRVQKQALTDSGISSVQELQELQMLSRMTPTQLAGSQLKTNGTAFQKSSLPTIPASTEVDTPVTDRLPSKPPQKPSADVAGRLSLIKSLGQESVDNLVKFANTADFDSIIGKGKAMAEVKFNPSVMRSITSLKQAIGYTLSGANIAKEEQKSIIDSISPSLFDSKESYLDALRRANSYINEFIANADPSMTDMERGELAKSLASKFNLTADVATIPKPKKAPVDVSKLSADDQNAITWAQQNRDNPDAKAILSLWGIE